MKYVIRIFAAVAIFLIILPFFVFVINERELAVVLRLGDPVREFSNPGVHFKLPLVETVQRLPKTQQHWGNDTAAAIEDVTTADNKKIELIAWAVWRIRGPRDFVQRLRTMDMAEQRVAQICRSTIRNAIGQYDLAELVRSTNRPLPTFENSLQLVAQELAESSSDGSATTTKPVAAENSTPASDAVAEIELGRTKLLEIIKQESQKQLTEQSADDSELGAAIELVDVGISRLSFVDTVRQATFDRWIAERQSISTKIVQEGEQRKNKIINAAKAEVEKIQGLGQKQASEIRGKADAQVIQRYAEAMNEVGDFYTFVRTLEAYETALNADSRMIFTTDSDFFKLLKHLEPGTAPPSP